MKKVAFKRQIMLSILVVVTLISFVGAWETGNSNHAYIINPFNSNNITNNNYNYYNLFDQELNISSNVTHNNITATTFCFLNGECISTWPTGGSGSSTNTDNYTTGISFSGTTTKTLSLNMNNGTIYQASFTDIDTDTDTTYSSLSEFNNDVGFVTNSSMNQSVSCSNIDGATSNLCTIIDTNTDTNVHLSNVVILETGNNEQLTFTLNNGSTIEVNLTDNNSGSGGSSVAGSNMQVQFNDGGVLNGSGIYYNKTSGYVGFGLEPTDYIFDLDASNAGTFAMRIFKSDAGVLQNLFYSYDGNNKAYDARMNFYRARGTEASPAPPDYDDWIGSMGWGGYTENDGTRNTISLVPITTEDWSDSTGYGARLVIKGVDTGNDWSVKSNWFQIWDGVLNVPATYNYVVGGTRKAMYVDSSGYIGVISSSERTKENFRSLDDISKQIYNLNPILFDYKDGTGDNQIGLIGEEVMPYIPELVAIKIYDYTDGEIKDFNKPYINIKDYENITYNESVNADLCYNRLNDSMPNGYEEEYLYCEDKIIIKLVDTVYYDRISVLLLNEVIKHKSDLLIKQNLIDTLVSERDRLQSEIDLLRSQGLLVKQDVDGMKSFICKNYPYQSFC